MALVGQIRKVLVHVQGREAPLLVNFTECLLGASSDSCRTNSLDVQHFSLCACRSGSPALGWSGSPAALDRSGSPAALDRSGSPAAHGQSGSTAALGRSGSPSPVSDCPHCEYFSCKLENDILILHKSDKESGVVLSHPPFCPVLHLTQEDIAVLPADIAGRGVDVGVVGLLQSVDGSILLTRRADHMRSFPRTWVPPGGHVELGESLEAAVSREMFEETGLTTEGCTVQLLCMWESVYPYILSMGQPTRHHLVLYYLVRSTKMALELKNKMKLDPGEVGAAAWLDRNQANIIASGVLKGDCSPLKIIAINKAGIEEECELPCSVLANIAPKSGPDIERISTGTRFAVNQWLKYENRN